ncbi:MBL fold metallo-hydrolase [Desulfonema magnum]|uniref:Beta-lactamase domain-containing protein n=1 Tax=Desulfonema magnum TaxID=45655 RepID=A0A975BGA8_9BACT|nr:MBL fold metallo-hydrolase [Desulfonema magnum]QTA85204.1 Beta-lactamase domain-containing protein [Desulfonema magnum]
MKITILGSGGCTVIPKPCCDCQVCKQARQKGHPYERTGPALFIHDINLLIDTPAEIACQLNRSEIASVDYLLFTHLDPDHVEGFRVVEQITLDFRTWEAYPEKQINLILPEYLHDRLKNIQTAYGPVIEFYENQGFVRSVSFEDHIVIGDIQITAIPVDRGSQTVFIYVFEQKNARAVYAPCDIRPFPEHRAEVRKADFLVIQPGIFEEGLKHGFVYPDDHISRTTLYTFEETLALAKRIQAGRILFVHLEEYWNRSYDDYLLLEKKFPNVRFAYDGLTFETGNWKLETGNWKLETGNLKLET